MKGTRWVFGAVLTIGVVALVAPAAGQGRTQAGSLRWFSAPGNRALTTYDFGAHSSGSSVALTVKLKNTRRTTTRKLGVGLYGSPAFSITSDKCSRKAIGPNLSCRVSISYSPIESGRGDVATIEATDRHGTPARLDLFGSCSASGLPNHAYWVNSYDETVKGAPLGGGCVNTIATGQRYANSVAVDGANVYWLSNGDLKEAPRGGGDVTTLASGLSYPFSLAVDGTHVYWLDYVAGTVNEVPIGGGSVTILATDQNHPNSLAADGTNVYWVDPGGYPGPNGTVNEVPVGGGSVTTLASGQAGPYSIAVDGTNVYWVNANGGTVNEVPVGGGPVTTLASGQAGPYSIAVDGTNVYWTNTGRSGYASPSVNEVPVGGGAVTTLASVPNRPYAVAVDATHVYWLEQGSGYPADGTVRAVPIGGGSVITLAGGQPNPISLAVGP